MPPHCCRMCATAGLRSLGDAEGFPFLECRHCGFVFTPILAREQERLYENGFHGVEEGAPETGWALKEPDFLDPALRILGPGPLTILDFGTGESRAPDLLRARGHRVLAVDVAPPTRPHPDRLTGSILRLQLPEDHFDLVFSFQVFEHIPDPAPILHRLIRLTRPDGLVLIHTDMETPERAAGDFLEWWYVLPPDHCSFYRPRTFETFLENTPHRLVWSDPKRVVIRVGPQDAGQRSGQTPQAAPRGPLRRTHFSTNL